MFALSNITIKGGSADRGGCIHIEYSSIVLNNITITECSANYGAGLYVQYNSLVESSNLSILNNHALYDGGGLMLYKTNMYDNGIDWGVDYWSTFYNTIIEDNSAPYGGGGIMLRDARIDFEDIILKNNSSNLYGGGALFMHRNSKSKIYTRIY